MKRALFLMTFLCLAVPTATGQEPAKVAPKRGRRMGRRLHLSRTGMGTGRFT